jgi:hypothetical protein
MVSDVELYDLNDLDCDLPNVGIVPIDVEIGGAALLALSR